MIITPAYRSTDPLLDEAVARSGMPWVRLYGHSDLPRARSILITKALASGAERIVMVDADNVPRPGQLEMAIRLTTPDSSAFGIYEQRQPGRWSVSPDGEVSAGAEVFPILFGGLGFACVHRDSLARVAERLPRVEEDGSDPWTPFCLPFVEGSEYHADDKSLCTRLRRSGTRLMCYPELRVMHAVTRLV